MLGSTLKGRCLNGALVISNSSLGGRLSCQSDGQFHLSNGNGIFKIVNDVVWTAPWLYMESDSYPFGEWGFQFTEVFLYTWAQFTDGSLRLKSKGIHWVAIAVQPQDQLCRTENGHDYTGEWAEVKAILMPLVNILLDESCYSLTNCRLL